ncbi:hypothetical protein J437_LFUL016248, partial [Ladona fulva]
RLVKNYLPFQLVENAAFRKFLEKLNNSYNTPSRKKISNELLPQLYNMTKETVIDQLKTGNYFCNTTDSLTSEANHNYISVTAHFIDASFDLRSNLLRQTAENLVEEQNWVAREWNLEEKIVAAVSDNATNIVAAIKLVEWK